MRETPDLYGIIYFNGTPLRGVSRNAKYSTPFALSQEFYIRPTLTDQWNVNDLLTVNNRFSYLHRTLSVLGNGDSTSTKVSDGEVVGRQPRDQADNLGDFDYQFEPLLALYDRLRPSFTGDRFRVSEPKSRHQPIDR